MTKEMIMLIINGFLTLIATGIATYYGAKWGANAIMQKSEIKLQKLRNLALKYINEQMSLSTLDKVNNILKFPDEYTSNPPLYYNTLGVFVIKATKTPYYYDEQGKIIKERINELKEQVKEGLWDYVLLWDITQYLASESNANMPNTMDDMLTKHLPTIMDQMKQK